MTTLSFRKYLILLALGVSASVGACKPTYPNSRDESLVIEPTISSDGKMVAVLDRSGQETPRLRLKWLDRDEPWIELPGPKYASSIRFGLKGYDLLITHARPGPQGASQLSRWDASHPEKPSEILYVGTILAFPVEVSPGKVLVRMCPKPPGPDACKVLGRYGIGLRWGVIEDGKLTQVTHGYLPSFSQPNVVKGGFFWFDPTPVNPDKIGTVMPPAIRAFALPGGDVPKFDISRFDKSTRDLQCDQKASRCLLHYLTDERINGTTFVYGFKVLNGGTTCVLPGLNGWHGAHSVTPDGRAAVMSLSRISTEPRHVVVLRFTPGQCEPTSVQHIHFEEK